MLLEWAKRDSISKSELEEVALDWLNETRRFAAPKTTRRRITSIHAFCSYAGFGLVLDDYNAPTPKAAQPHPLPGGMEDVYSMIEVATTEEYKALIALCGLCGLRVSEAVDLEDINIDWPRGELSVRGKGDKTRIVPMSERAMTEIASVSLRTSIRGGGKLLPFYERSAREKITEFGWMAGVTRRVASHDLRATFATSLYLLTKDIELVRKVLGHASVTTTQAYVDIANDLIRKGVNLL